MGTRLDQHEFAHLTLPAAPACLHVLRGHVRGWLAALALAPDRLDEIVLAVDEAAANAVDHAYGPDGRGVVEVSMWTESDALFVQVRDAGRWREPPPAPPPTRGLGVTLMRRLMDGVLIHHDRHGTQVLFRHPLTRFAPDRTPPVPPRDPGRAGNHRRDAGTSTADPG